MKLQINKISYLQLLNVGNFEGKNKQFLKYLKKKARNVLNQRHFIIMIYITLKKKMTDRSTHR